MQNSLFQAICRVGIFMICAQAVIHFRPQESYEKYLKLLVSVMVLIQLFLPIGGFLLGGGGQDVAGTLAEFKQELEESMKKAEENAAKADALLERMTLEELRRQLEEQRAGKEGGGKESGIGDGLEGDGKEGGVAGGGSEGSGKESGIGDGLEGEGENGFGTAAESGGSVAEEAGIYVEPVKPVVIGGNAPQ